MKLLLSSLLLLTPFTSALANCESPVHTYQRSIAGSVLDHSVSHYLDGILNQSASDTCGGADLVISSSEPNTVCWAVNVQTQSCVGSIQFQCAVNCSSN